MRVLELEPGKTPQQWGQHQGEAFRPLIAELAAIRMELTIERGGFANARTVRALAVEHLPVLEQFAPDLLAELIGISEGADLAPADVVVLNHYTDLRDIRRPPSDRPPSVQVQDEECSAVWARAPGGPVLGQTWDMHGTAMPYVMMLGVPGRDGAPAAWLLSITGCLGMAGMNDAGVGITINNLRSTDARVGVVWPALVRRVLQERSASEGRDVIVGAPLGSGHHYLVADGQSVFGIETSGSLRKEVFSGGADAYVHANHCFDDEVAECTVILPESTTHARQAALAGGIARLPIRDRADLWARLGSHEGYPRFVCTHMAHPAAPHGMLTCGAIVMDLAERDAWAAHGCVHHSRPHYFPFSD